ncbi:hypothetical protein FACS1894182_14740 [Bacteroidia bacterium]|nr:hypothetical protein FACS1894182_14740 [Bacteroidia bacterium]
MKNVYLLFLPVVFTAFSCKKGIDYSATNDNNIAVPTAGYCLNPQPTVNLDDDFVFTCHPEPIETKAFVTYWKAFRNAVINHDTIALNLMICDNVKANCGFLDGLYGIISKSVFIQKIDSLFTPIYLRLLYEYDINKNLDAKREKWQYEYTCRITIDDKEEYQAYIYFNNNIVIYSMSFSIMKDASDGIKLSFIQTSDGVKLIGIDCFMMMIV